MGGCQIQDPVRAGHDGDQLVHISRRLSDPHAGAQQCCTGSGWHSDWLLRFRYHLKVWRWVAHLSDHIREVRQAVFVGVIGICQLLKFFRVKLCTINYVFSSAVTSAHGDFHIKDNSPWFECPGEGNERGKPAQVMTVISWCTYPVVYLIPMLVPNSAAKAVVGIQIGYCASDIISKCGVGLLIYQITYAKSDKASLLPPVAAAN